MENGEVNIPVSFEILGNKINIVFNDDSLAQNNELGLCDFNHNRILIATNHKGQKIPDDVAKHTYWHEVAHAMLHHMGETELRDNEKFVDLLGGMIYQVLKTSVYDTNGERENTTATRTNKRTRKRS